MRSKYLKSEPHTKSESYTTRRGGRPLRRTPVRFIVLAALAFALLAPSVALAATPPRSSVSDKIMCQCGCGAVLTNCPHQDCGWGIPAKSYIDEQLGTGKAPEELVQYYVAQYGDAVLAAPTKTGFNVVGWVMPFVGLAVGAVAIYFLLGMWSARRGDPVLNVAGEVAAKAPDPDDRISRRLEDELRDFD